MGEPKEAFQEAFMATRTRKSSLEETPIKHTAGGEMPDPTDQHHVNSDELEALGGVEGEESTSNFLDQAKNYFPMILGAIGVGVGVYFLVQRYKQGDFDRIKDKWGEKWGEKWGKRFKSDKTTNEADRALDVDDVQPTRLMGA
jgi:hypothetical protein